MICFVLLLAWTDLQERIRPFFFFFFFGSWKQICCQLCVEGSQTLSRSLGPHEKHMCLDDDFKITYLVRIFAVA